MRLGRAVSLALPLALALAVDVAQAAGPPPRVWANLAARRAALRLPLTECNPGWGQESMLCGTFDVYENRALGSGRRLSLWVVVIPSLSERPEPDPVFYLAGGPGGSASGAASWFATELPLRLKRDIVLVDLRGMGGSNPLLCDLVGDRDVLQNHLRDMYPPELVDECRRELEQRADLTQYTTANAMADLDDVRAWLGYERINLLALSYGGRAAYAYARASIPTMCAPSRCWARPTSRRDCRCTTRPFRRRHSRRCAPTAAPTAPAMRPTRSSRRRCAAWWRACATRPPRSRTTIPTARSPSR
ncbi:MAG: alpha/beta fold hydrolase [bacterium]|nr:alpha/beta fold hydrolase [bacterium]